MAASPLVVIPARFSASTSALRFGAVVTARTLSEAVLRAGGEPLTVHPWAPGGRADPAEVGRRLDFADAVLLPGGGDLDPACYGQPAASEYVYDVDAGQDRFDLAVARWALTAGRPLLAICRGLQVVNVARGGTLVQHMDRPHRPAGRLRHKARDRGGPMIGLAHPSFNPPPSLSPPRPGRAARIGRCRTRKRWP